MHPVLAMAIGIVVMMGLIIFTKMHAFPSLIISAILIGILALPFGDVNTLTQVVSTVTSGFGDVQLGLAGVNQNICQTGNNITGAVRDGFYTAEIGANGRQMANMQQLYGLLPLRGLQLLRLSLHHRLHKQTVLL